MAHAAHRKALLMDTRLTDSARVLGLYVESLGAGSHRIGSDDFARVLHGAPSRETVSRSLRALRLHGYIEQRPGGRGHADVFTFRGGTSDDLNDGTEGPNDPDRPIPSDDLNEDSPPRGDDLKPDRPITSDDLSPDRLSPDRDLKDRVSPDPHLNGPHAGPPHSGAAFEPSTDEQIVEGGDVEEARAPDHGDRDAPDPRFSTRVRAALQKHWSLLDGCRDSLQDYLLDHVDPDRQFSYVHMVAAWLNRQTYGWCWPDGTMIPPDQHTHLLAIAANELGATDETGRKHPVGDPVNLLNKLDFVIQREFKNGQRNGRTAGGPYAPPRGAAAAAGASSPGSQEHRRRRKHGSAR